MLTKRCLGECGKVKHNHEFHNSRRNICKECCNARRRKRYKTDIEYRNKYLTFRTPEYWKRKADRYRHRCSIDPDYDKKEKEREKARGYKKLLKKYGLTAATEKVLLGKQNHKCLFCERPFSDKLKINRDHDHSLKHFRGFLCRNCNLAIGHIENTGCAYKTLQNMIEMIEANSLFIQDSQYERTLKSNI